MKSGFARSSYDAIVVGAGPNGFACAITLAQKGLKVALVERNATWGGGARTEELTLPGFRHDICSAVHPLAVASPFFKTLNLEHHGLEWINSPLEVAHPLDGGDAVVLRRSIFETAAALGPDEKRYVRFYRKFTENLEPLMAEVMGPVIHRPKHPVLLGLFGLHAVLSAKIFANVHFKDMRTRALFMGIAAHSAMPLNAMASAGVGLVLQVAAHGGGWPIPRGGSQSISDALASCFKSLGGEIILNSEVKNLDSLPESHDVFFDLTPRQILNMVGDNLSIQILKGFENFRYGPGVFKLDWALNSPIPWQNPDCARAATVHLGGTADEIVASEEPEKLASLSRKPYVILTQPSLFDSSRAPAGKHVAWAYCHVANGSLDDMTESIEGQIERFAPGFRKTVLKRNARTTRDLERHNPNLVGGDISGGLISARQIFFRPRVSLSSYSLGGERRRHRRRFWICSSSTPPGPGVHGMCGHDAALAALAARL